MPCHARFFQIKFIVIFFEVKAETEKEARRLSVLDEADV